jgi:hypothetical protein
MRKYPSLDCLLAAWRRMDLIHTLVRTPHRFARWSMSLSWSGVSLMEVVLVFGETPWCAIGVPSGILSQRA